MEAGTGSLMECLEDFKGRFNANPRVKKLIKGWDRVIKLTPIDKNDHYYLLINNLNAEIALSSEEDDGIALHATDEVLREVFSGNYNPSHALIDGALAVYSSDSDKIKLEAIAMLIWGI